MKYRLYRLSFPHGIHAGDHNLDESMISFHADTLFSAMYQEALKLSEEKSERFLWEAKEGLIQLSDTFPYIGETEYLPKPMCRVEAQDQQGDSVLKKAYKALSFIPMEKMSQYLQGGLDALTEKEKLSKLGVHDLKTSAAITGLEETMPYHVGVFYFHEGNGLYLIIGTEEGTAVEELLYSLSYTGIGGKRSAGFGRFDITDIRELKGSPFNEEGSLYMTLSVALPSENELEPALSQASYQMIRRSGFVASGTYAPELRKKRDLYVMTAGSCFGSRFSGDIYDVSEGGSHPVYRYEKPLFWTLRR